MSKATTSAKQLRQLALLCIAALPGFLAAAEAAQVPIRGGLGINLGDPLNAEHLGAELTPFPLGKVPDNRAYVKLSEDNGQQPPWRILRNPVLPLPFRKHNQSSYVMVDAEQRVMRVISRVDYQGCDKAVEWLKQTLAKKYQIEKELLGPSAPGYEQYEHSMRLEFSERQIDVHCGPDLLLDYADYRAIRAWQKQRTFAEMDAARLDRDMERKRLVLEQRRARHFADEFTLGDQYRLMGAFGIAFEQPFAPRSTQKFPVDRPFTAILPNLINEFQEAQIVLELGPDRVPVSIRARFLEPSFSRLEAALKAKYGLPMKATPRHVVHKIGSNHAILKQLNEQQIELAFIDSVAKNAQRDRLWEQESEGL